MISLYALYSNLKYDILYGHIKVVLCTLGLCLFYGRLIVIPLETWLDIFWGCCPFFYLHEAEESRLRGMGSLWVAFN